MPFKKKKPYRPQYKKKPGQPDAPVQRVKMPGPKQVFGKIEALLGGRRTRVKCSDHKIRVCRTPGRVRLPRLREEDYVIVEPWEVGGDEKGDVIWKYKVLEAEWLERKGYLKDI